MIIETDKALADAARKRLERYAEADKEYDEVCRAVTKLTGQPIDAPPPVVEQADPPTNNAVRTTIETDPIPPENAGLTDLLRWAIRHFPQERFTAPDLAAVLKEHGRRLGEKKGFVASSLTKLVDRGEIVRVQRGAGRTPTVFQRGGHDYNGGLGPQEQP